MSDSNFSSLIYRIIGKPERWHDDYIVEMMQQYLNEADAVDDPLNLLELQAGEQILSRLAEGNQAITAFNSLLDKSRFKMIILDDHFKPLYHNKIADQLYAFVLKPTDQTSLKPDLLKQIQGSPDSQPINQQNSLHVLDFHDQDGTPIYIRTIHSKVSGDGETTLFHLLMVLDHSSDQVKLNAELVAQYGLTNKEQDVLLRLIHGDTIKKIAVESFVTENTVRSHLKAIFRKTGTKSQGALISLVLTHESQVLDSYFDSDITTIGASASRDTDKEVTLSCGQKIAYCEYGPSSGRPIIVFHSGFGSRLAAPPNHDEVCKRLNRRIIVPDRPGLGKTPFVEGHPQQWNQQLTEFIELLGIEQYEVIGSIIACQMAMSFAAQADARLTRLILTSPVYLNTDDDAEYLTEILAPAAKYVKLSPEFAKEIYTLWLKAVTLNLDVHYAPMLQESVGSAERKMFEEQDMFQLLTDVFKEGARNSLNGILNEMVYCMTPLHLDLSKITIPVDIWYGTEDKRITRRGVENIFKPLPNHTLHIHDGYSEHIYYSLFEQIIA